MIVIVYVAPVDEELDIAHVAVSIDGLRWIVIVSEFKGLKVDI